jgi:acetolactate synthase-1/2/3 large subunit
LPTRYERVVTAFGGHGEHVDTAGALLPAAERAYRSGLPACLNVAMEGVPAPVVKRAAAAPAGQESGRARPAPSSAAR